MRQSRNNFLVKSSNKRKKGKSLLLDGLGKAIQTFLRSTTAHGEVVNTEVVIAVAALSF